MGGSKKTYTINLKYQITMTLTPKKFQTALLNWFDHHGRKNLPWQQDKTPYRVWISEIMLQQTQVSTVIPYFQKFMLHFNNVQQLANATEDQVLHLWTGLGYYSRARNLHRAAKMIQQNFHGKFPDNYEDLISLPGIGRSTAGAILSIAFQQKAAILDGNVKRVLTRLGGITEWPGEKKVTEQLWELAEKLTPAQRTAEYTQAMMDMGATICVRSKPHCEKCPFTNHCRAHQLGIEKKLPAAKPKKTLPVRQKTFLILQHDHHVLLQKRPASGIWGGLWSTPELMDFAADELVEQFCQQQQLTIKNFYFGEAFRHTFSHFHLDILPVFITLKSKPRKIMDSDRQIWYNLQQAQIIGLPQPVKKLLLERT